jgi:fumarylacetoacetate (FAA) hydrolase
MIMKLATLRDGSRDGRLIVVRRDAGSFAEATAIAPTLQAALDDWKRCEPALRALAADLESGQKSGIVLDVRRLASPLPRAYEWIDGSAYLSHVLRVRRSRGAEPPPAFETEPLVYQGGSGAVRGPTDPIVLGDVAWGLDFEAELCVVLADTPAGTTAAQAARQILLLGLLNDVSLRGLAPAELAKGFGFLLAKPRPAFAPFFVTPDELGADWRDGRAYLSVRCAVDGHAMGDIDSGREMHFSFFDLIAHIARTRSFVAGTLLGGGTVSSADPTRGTGCLVERRALEVLERGTASTPYLKPGDQLTIEAFDANGQSVFGRIEQAVIGP